ncbi:unnamed protein product [Lymnaea stagnalis]|uniref:Uncharacterized protein n=1 Tax=Lymnaea stagnalis TaxID=6523 RepID=A0AAV2I9B7_LYMST
MFLYIDGSTLSRLLFSHLNSHGGQYGFLLGERIEQIEDKISDSQIHTSNVNSFIYISSFIPWLGKDLMYHRNGCINEKEMDRLLQKTDQTLVGWYSFRHQTRQRPSFRELTLHDKLTKADKYVKDSSDFLFFLCTSSFSKNMSTHLSSHGFMHLIDRKLVEVPMTIMNLGDTTRKEYRKQSNATLSHCKTVQASLIKHGKDHLQPSGEMDQITKIKSLSSSFNKGLMAAHKAVVATESVLGALEAEVNYLKQQLDAVELEEMNFLHEMENEQKIKNEEDLARLNKRTEEDENEQIQQLLLNLGMSNQNVHPVSGPASSYDESHNFRGFQGIDSMPSLPANSSNVNMTSRDFSSNNVQPQILHVDKKQGRAANSPKDVPDRRDKQRTKAKTDKGDPFSFVDDVLQQRKPNGADMQGTSLQSKSSLTSQDLNHTATTSAALKEVYNKAEMPNKGHRVMGNTASKPAPNSGNSKDERSENSDGHLGKINSCEETVTLSSSPVF